MVDWIWDKPIAITEDQAKMLVARIVEAVTKDRQGELLEQFRQFARTEADLARVREQVTNLIAENTGLRAHITTLNNLLTTMAPGNGAPVFPTNHVGAQPFGTTVTMPMLPHQPPYGNIPNIPPPPPIIETGAMKSSPSTG